MRYTTPYPVDFETSEDGNEPMEPTADAAAPADDTPAADDAAAEPVDDGGGPEEPDAAAEPPLWTTADGHLVHLPPKVVDRIVVRRPPRWPRPRRPGLRPLDERLRRRRAISTIGRLVRRASRVGPRTGVGPPRLPVFRGGFGRRNFRFVTRPRGLRHEILAIEPELMSEGVYQELETPSAPAEPITTAVPFAPPPTSVCYWPVQTAHPQASVVSYLTTGKKEIGRPGRRFMANRTGTRNGVPKTPRYHCGIDLFARRRDPVIACEDGVVRKFAFFYKAKSGQDTCQLLIEHAGCVVNYGELMPDSDTRAGITVGARVRAGQVIGYVSDTDMLHFETYVPGTKTSHRWWKGTSPPRPLLNPTRYLLHVKQHGRPAASKAAPSATPRAPLPGGPQGITDAMQRTTEQAAITQAINRGQRDPGTLASLVFHARHPERNRRPLKKGEPNFDRLAAEWLDIRDRLVKPLVEGARPPAVRPVSPVTPTPAPATAGDAPRGPFGTLTVTAPGRTFRYRFTPEDVLWTARLVQGEAGGDDSLKNVAVVWALANRYGLFHKDLGDKTFAGFIRRYSTVLQPYLRHPNAIARAMDTSKRNPGNPALKWVEVPPGTFVDKKTGKIHPAGQYQKHLTLQRTPWSGLRSGARNVAERVLGGREPSPIGLASDFDGPHIFLAGQLRKAGKSLAAIREASPEEYRRLWLAFITQHVKTKKGKTWIGEGSPKLEQMTSNAFYAHPITRSLPASAVRIVPG